MPFIYIDSQGREVKIPSVDALRLRIELGAIKDQTQFHDENAGRWAPAVEHDIYRTLKRELETLESGFVAPPPPSSEIGDAEAPAEGDAPAPDDLVAEPQPPVGADETADDPAPVESGAPDIRPVDVAPPAPEPDEDADAADPFAMNLGIAPSEPASPPEEAPGPEAGTGEADEDEDDGFDVGPLWDDEPDLGEGEETPVPNPAAGAEPGGRDVAAEDPAEADEAAAPPDETRESFVASAEEELMGSVSDAGGGVQEDAGLTLEPTLAESFDADAGMQPEPPAALPQDPDDVPDWMSDPPAEPAPEPPAAVAAPDPAADWQPDAASAEVRRPRTAPPPRKLTRARSPGAQGVVGLVLLVLVVGAASVFGWRYLSPLLGGGVPEEPEVALPPLDAALVPRMTELTGAAAAGMSAALLDLPERAEIPAEPSRDWLAGIYLANASDYPNVPGYWESVRAWTDAARAAETAAFREAYQAEVDASGLPAPDAEAVRNRGLAGFQAAAGERRVVYDQLQAVADRALALHEFLLANEDQVDYEPAASGVSRDPVLEAVPATEELRDAMWDRVGSITNAMDALGYLDQIDTARLLGTFLEKLEASAVR